VYGATIKIIQLLFKFRLLPVHTTVWVGSLVALYASISCRTRGEAVGWGIAL